MIQQFSTLKRTGFSILLTLLLAIPAFGAVSAAPAPQTTPDSTAFAADMTECVGGFAMTVRNGTNTSKSFGGVLRLRANSAGDLRESELAIDGGGTAKVTGTVTGQAVAMVFDLGNNTVMFGVGVMQKSLAECSGIAAGPFVGPEKDDRGDWDWFEGSIDARRN